MRYARLACRHPSRGAATSCSLGREPQGSDVRNLSSPGGAASRTLRGERACDDVAPLGLLGAPAKVLGLAPQAT